MRAQPAGTLLFFVMLLLMADAAQSLVTARPWLINNRRWWRWSGIAFAIILLIVWVWELWRAV
jgi:hypothetical protein